MIRVFWSIILMAAAACCMGGCSSTMEAGAPSSEPVDLVAERSWPAMAVVDWGQVDFSDPKVVADFAQADIIVLETSYLWREWAYSGAIAALKAQNPDVKVVGYISAHASWEIWGEVDRSAEEIPYYSWEWYQATKPYWSYTTTGDTMQSWPGKNLLNVLDPNCRAAMVEVLAQQWTLHENVLDGILWDHFNDYLWVPLTLPGVEGEMDLDGDGIPHRQDEDEMQAYRDASVDLIQRTRRALGADVIQIANGQRAPSDSLFAGLLDGMFYENFPEYNWGGDKMRGALDPTKPNNLFTVVDWPRKNNGGPWLILSNASRFAAINEQGQYEIWRQAEFNRVVALLTGCTSVYYAEGLAYRYGWPEVEFELGLPAGPAIFEGNRISREFEGGSVHLDFEVADTAAPFDFAVVQKDSVRQRFYMEDMAP